MVPVCTVLVGSQIDPRRDEQSAGEWSGELDLRTAWVWMEDVGQHSQSEVAACGVASNDDLYRIVSYIQWHVNWSVGLNVRHLDSF